MPQTDQAADLSRQFLKFTQNNVLAMRERDALPESLDAWASQKRILRNQLLKSWGGFPKDHCPLEPRILGTVKRDGYRIEKLLLQTRPGVLMTANAYVPDGEGRRSAVLCVHGHWRLAKSEPVVQSRCIGLAKLGFFVLMVDCFGAGERGLGPALGEYHGEMVAATLYPTGLPLSGLQVYENMRAVDYLQSRPEVDPERIGITGASGGGNQTMYAGAFDERFKCVVPTCSVGTYQSYLGAACCMCEVVPAAMSYTEEWGVLSLVAPRGLMLINASRDSFQFSIGEAKKSLEKAKHVFRLFNVEENARHATFESKHDYNQPMREAMYGWMTRHLKGEGDGSPIDEPEFETEEAEVLRCFPGDSRPESFVTLPQFAAAQGRMILERRPLPKHPEHWEAEETKMRESLPRALGRFPRRSPLNAQVTTDDDPKKQSIEFNPERGITVFATRTITDGKRKGLAVLLDLDNGRKASTSSLGSELLKSGWDVVTADLRATGATTNRGDSIGRAPDHNSGEWSLWAGRPLLGQWIHDVVRLLDTVDEHAGGPPETTAVIGVGSASLVALGAAALDPRIDRVATVGGLASYISDVPYEKQRLGIMVPDILRTVGDIPHLASLAAPRRLVIAGSVNGAGESLSGQEQQTSFEWTRTIYQIAGGARQVKLMPETDAEELTASLIK